MLTLIIVGCIFFVHVNFCNSRVGFLSLQQLGLLLTMRNLWWRDCQLPSRRQRKELENPIYIN